MGTEENGRGQERLALWAETLERLLRQRLGAGIDRPGNDTEAAETGPAAKAWTHPPHLLARRDAA